MIRSARRLDSYFSAFPFVDRDSAVHSKQGMYSKGFEVGNKQLEGNSESVIS